MMYGVCSLQSGERDVHGVHTQVHGVPVIEISMTTTDNVQCVSVIEISITLCTT